MTTITAIVPTIASDIDRLAKLRRSMLSALHQLRDGDELLCAGDTREGPLDDVRELCLHLSTEAPEGVTVRYLPHDGGRPSFGHDQLNAATRAARGDYLTGCDDDDVWAAGAMDAIRAAADALPNPAPLLFRFKSYHGGTFWLAPGLLGEGLIGGHCAVFPNIPSKLGEWSPRYEGDWDYIKTTLALWAEAGVEPLWIDRLICIARPT